MSKMEILLGPVPDDLLMNVMNRYGGLLKTLARSPHACDVVRLVHLWLGKLTAAAAGVTGIYDGRDAVEISRLMMDKFFSSIMEVERAGEREWTFSFSKCPYGIEGEEDHELCHAVMNLEHEIVRGLGGTLDILERIPEGASRCRFTVRSS